MEWISLRNEWPREPGRYRVKDCRQEDFNCEGETYYNGWDFERWEPQKEPLKGAMILRVYTTTHWMKT